MVFNTPTLQDMCKRVPIIRVTWMNVCQHLPELSQVYRCYYAN